jgi:hypothetical protein
MKQSFYILILIFLAKLSFSQDAGLIFRYKSRIDTIHYSKTNFNKVDTLERWCYSISYKVKPSRFDPAKPLCLVSFNRTSSFTDSTGYLEYKKGFEVNSEIENYLKEQISYKPFIHFLVYQIRDSAAAYKISEFNMRFTANPPPNGGGDLFTIGNFIFVNDEMSIRCCSPFGGKIDYCRPLINFIFMPLKTKKFLTVAELLSQLPIKKCAIE